ncbi:acylneuraminate cytidylyltransferase family protein [uncultured Desulfosarcina sp.]|uniref:acylneuraminate cytidylyltransferase family protein n=1 Tax=uncultured Desulfosarcina sp. TaxID=218289 RepID=UPI0029C95C81|nr:acylneuraminate cytidylyltransferase family protein [uncultured Desulfosarcina sp.]
MPDIVALIPMRHKSERISGKNYRLFAGKPLYHYIIDSLSACSFIREIVVDTDSHIIREDAQKNFPDVRLIERPSHLKAGTVPMNNVLLHDISCVKADFYIQSHSTNPLLRPETITRAVRLFLEKYPGNDSLFSVTRLQSRFWTGSGEPINHNPEKLLRTQDLPALYEENSCLYIFSHKTMENRRNRIGESPILFEIDRLEACDIDEEIDFHIAEFLYNKSKEGKLSHGLEDSGNSALPAAGDRSV